MSTEENKAVVHRFIDAFHRRDVAAFGELAAPELAKVAIEQWMPAQDATWADHELGITKMLAEDEWVWAHLTYSGRQIGEFRDLPPMGKTSTGESVAFMRVSGGKVVEFSGIGDDLARIQQLGGVIVPGGQ